MKKIWKRVVAAALAFSLVAGTGNITENNWIYAAEAGSGNCISTSYDEATNITLSIKNESIVFEDLPDEAGFEKMILVSLYGDNNGETIGKKQLKVSAQTTYSLSGVADGIYYVQLYYLNSSGTKFKSYWLKKNGVKIKKTGDKIVFLQSETYESNLDMYRGRASSSQALEYYLKPDSFVDCDNPAIKKKALEITKGMTDDYEKVKAVHDWIAGNIWYDYDGLYQKSPIEYVASDVLESKKSVCQGFADLAAAFLRSLGIPTKVTNGYAMGVGTSEVWTEDILSSNQSNHAWNESYVNGRWVIYDCTWDSDNKYVDGKFSKDTGCTGHCYFDLTVERFSNTHFIMDKEEKFLNAMAGKMQSVTCQEYVAGEKKAIWNKEFTISDLEYQFESANEGIAVVDKYGVVTGVAEGRVKIKVILAFQGVSVSYQLPVIVEEGNGETNSAEIEAPITDKTEEPVLMVSNVPDTTNTNNKAKEKEDDEYHQPILKNTNEMLQEIAPAMKEVNLIYGGSSNNSAQLLYYCDEEIRGKFKITYWMEDCSVARISSSGIITASGVGETTLHITYQADEYKAEDEIDIYVKGAKISILAGNKKIKKGKTKTLTAKTSYISGTVKWKTSNKKIATVSSKGKVSAKKKGKVTITAYIGNVKSSVKLTVY